jgi:predicted DNA-binding protein (MmcQ/YjbR family)
MTLDSIRRYCLSLPHATEQVQWGNDLLFKIGGKMFAIAPLEPAAVVLSFKCTPDNFAELTERLGIRPAAYLARNYWISLETADALPPPETKQLLRESYDLVFAKLPKKARTQLLDS